MLLGSLFRTRMDQVASRLFKLSMLAQGLWFAAGPPFLYTYAAECASFAPDTFHSVLKNYVVSTVTNAGMMGMLYVIVSIAHQLDLFTAGMC